MQINFLFILTNFFPKPLLPLIHRIKEYLSLSLYSLIQTYMLVAVTLNE